MAANDTYMVWGETYIDVYVDGALTLRITTA